MTAPSLDVPRAISLSEHPLLGGLYARWLAGEAGLAEALTHQLADPAAWRTSAPAAPEASFWKDTLEYNRRLGASARALQSCEAMAAGQADAVVAGQQPGLVGGPLYSLLKLATAVALAERGGARARCPVFWMAADDTDFPEIRGARVARELELPGVLLPEALHVAHRMVGSLDGAATRETGETLLAQAGGPHAGEVQAAWRRASGRGSDFGEIFAAFLFELLPDWPFVVVDARRPALRAASTPVFARYLERRAEVAAALSSSAAWLTERGYEVRLEPRSAEHSLYRTQGDLRLKWEFPSEAAAAVAELRGLAGQISANVVLRPLAQDAVLPNVAQVVGPGEAAYLVQVRRVAGLLDAPRPALFPRLSLTLWPAEAAQVCAALGAPEARLLSDFDSSLRAYHAAQLPAAVRAELDAWGESLTARARALEEASREVDASLPQLVESARGKMDFQLGRVRDGVLSKVRARHDRQFPRLARLKGFLLPGEKLQERSLASASVFAQWGSAAGARLLDLARRHVDDTARGASAHYIVGWEG